MKPYSHLEIEEKWQKIWEEKGAYRAADFDSRPKKYLLFEFPYPSGDRLHVGHARSYTALDAMARKSRMDGYNILLPMGWDAFGLPAENYAIKNKVSPQKVTADNIANAKKQAQSWGLSIDWDREINTTDPDYYKWTQWIFLQLFKKGLAYRTKTQVNWCPSCKTNLANEEVLSDGTHERCGFATEKREQEQWVIKITEYADRLIDDLEKVDFLEKIKTQQINWIGRSEGSLIKFPVKNSQLQVEVFTTRADTLFGCTYIVIAPESDYIENLKSQISNLKDVEDYIEKAKKKSAIDRTNAEKEKTGVKLEGVVAINPINGREIPVFVADYVLADYGTGAVMAVPAHDERDWDFAKKYDLPTQEVVVPNIIDRRNPPVPGKKVVTRQNIHAIVRDPDTGKYLAIKWHRFPWTTFPMGGVDEKEDIVEAARREVREETGFINLKHVETLGGHTRAEYFAANKDENRVAYTTAVLFELIDKEQVEIADEDKGEHDTIWLDKSQLNYDNMTHAEIEEWQRQLKSGSSMYSGEGYLIDSDSFSGTTSQEARTKITEKLKTDGKGDFKMNYHLRDWIFSRQRYWGEPIPIVHCEKCGYVAVPEEDLPVKLPDLEHYEPSGTGESPLAKVTDWVETTCPQCGGKATRETDTMPNWAGSNWYYLAYLLGNEKLKNGQFGNEESKKIFSYWMPIDLYNGGMEHTTLHLLYSRFIYKFLYDIGVVPTSEPYQSRRSHGMILGPDRQKMSKSRGNVVNPDDVVTKYGADTFRVYESFIGPFDQMTSWSDESLAGCSRFLSRVWTLAQTKVTDSSDATVGVTQDITESQMSVRKKLHKVIKKVGGDIDEMKFNTAVAAMMEFINSWQNEGDLSKEDAGDFLKILCPFAPHITEELWENIGLDDSIHSSSWPKYDESLIKDEIVTIVIQENGKLRGNIEAPFDSSEEDVVKICSDSPKFASICESAQRTIYVKNKLINFVTK